MITSNGVNVGIIESFSDSQQDFSIEQDYSELPLSAPTKEILDISGESDTKQSFTRPISGNNPGDADEAPIPNLAYRPETESNANDYENGPYIERPLVEATEDLDGSNLDTQSQSYGTYIQGNNQNSEDPPGPNPIPFLSKDPKQVSSFNSQSLYEYDVAGGSWVDSFEDGNGIELNINCTNIDDKIRLVSNYSKFSDSFEGTDGTAITSYDSNYTYYTTHPPGTKGAEIDTAQSYVGSSSLLMYENKWKYPLFVNRTINYDQPIVELEYYFRVYAWGNSHPTNVGLAYVFALWSNNQIITLVRVYGGAGDIRYYNSTTDVNTGKKITHNTWYKVKTTLYKVDGLYSKYKFSLWNTNNLNTPLASKTGINVYSNGHSSIDKFSIQTANVWNNITNCWFDGLDIVGRGFYNPGHIQSKPISLPKDMYWDSIYFNKTEPTNCEIEVNILNAANNQLINGPIKTLDEINIRDKVSSDIYPSIKLSAVLISDGERSPILNDWGVSWNATNAWRDTLFGGLKESALNLTSGDGEIWLNTSPNEFYKYEGNPILTIGPGSSWDNNGVSGTSIINNGTEYMMWYHGQIGSSREIGLATSADGITWTKYNGNPVLKQGSTSAWDGYNIEGPCVLFDGKIYMMWYVGKDSSADLHIGYATSTDGINWKKHPNNPVLTIGSNQQDWDGHYVRSPEVYYDGMLYHMWFEGLGGTTTNRPYQIGYATSYDGINWTKYPNNPIIRYPTAWYLGKASLCVFPKERGFLGWYFFKDGTNFWINHTISSDGINWLEYSNNPVLTNGSSGTWDDVFVAANHILMKNKQYYMYYTGGGSNSQIGLAKSKFDPFGSLNSTIINVPKHHVFDRLFINKTEPTGTYINVSIIDVNTNTSITNFNNLRDNWITLSSLNLQNYTSIRLVANFSSNEKATPILYNWAVTWKIPELILQSREPYTGMEGSPILFNANEHLETYGSGRLRYEWDWNLDGLCDDFTFNPFINYTWLDDFYGEIGLRINDTITGKNVSGEIKVIVKNVPPKINCSELKILPNSVFVGENITIQNISFYDPGDDTYEYNFSMNDYWLGWQTLIGISGPGYHDVNSVFNITIPYEWLKPPNTEDEVNVTISIRDDDHNTLITGTGLTSFSNESIISPLVYTGSIRYNGRKVVFDKDFNIYVIFASWKIFPRRVTLAKSDDNGHSWKYYIVSNKSYYSNLGDLPSIVIDSKGVLHVVWRNVINANEQHIVYACSHDGGETWVENYNITASGTTWGPAMCVDYKDNLHITWWGDTNSSPNGIWYINRSSTGVWGQKFKVSNNIYSYESEICSDSKGNVHIVWYESDATKTRRAVNIRHRILWLSNNTWSQLIKATSDAWPANNKAPKVTVDKYDNLHLVWYGNDSIAPAYNNIMYSKFNAGSGRWSVKEYITNFTTAYTDFYRPSIEIDNSGKLYVIWGGYTYPNWTSPYVMHYAEKSGSTWDVHWNYFNYNTTYHSYQTLIQVDPNQKMKQGFIFIWIDKFFNLKMYTTYDFEFGEPELVDGLDWCNKTVILKLKPLEVNANGPYFGIEGYPVRLQANCTSNNYLLDFEYSWDLENDSTFDTSWSTSTFYDHIWYDDYTGMIAVQVRDNFNRTAIGYTKVFVINLPPIVSAGLDQTINEGETAYFSGLYTDPGTLDTHTILWDFGVGNTSSGSLTTSHHYPQAGLYNVILTIRDDDGGVGIDNLTLVVKNLVPIADAGVNITVYEGQTYTLNGTIKNPGHDVLYHYWDFDITRDGSDTDNVPDNDVDSTLLNTTHVHMKDGKYTAKLFVADDDGSKVVDYVIVTVLDLTPTADFTWSPQPQYEGSAVQYNDLSTSYPDSIVSWSWVFGDGTISANQNPTHAYLDNDVYSVTLTVRDEDNSSANITYNITILNIAPNAEAGTDQEGEEVATFNFTGSCTDPGTLDIHTYEWDFDYDGSTFDVEATGQSASNTWFDDFNGYVALRVTDDDGGNDIDTCHVLVKNVAPTVELKIIPISVNISIRIAGEKWHDVVVEVFENDIIIANGSLTRYPGSPNEQMLHLTTIKTNVKKIYSATIRYTPEDDPVNGQKNGATPCWVIMKFADGTESRAHHTFNVKHPKTYLWKLNLTQQLHYNNITFEASVLDPGADDLTFYWSFGDGNNITTFYPNTNNNFPVEIIERISHTFLYTGIFTVTLTVKDDDSGIDTKTISVAIR
jgi:PKD repeat protein/predicted GH43/DUF377 family glycosyl hydrolase